MNSSAPPMQNATGKQTEKKKNKSGASKIGQGFYDLLTSVKKARINYTENNGTFLPGYIPTVGFLGRDNYGGGLAPTFGFVFGSQVDIKQRAVENGWLISRDINDPYYNRTFSNTHLSKLEASVTLRPAPSLDIDLRGNRTYTESISQQLDVINDVLNEDSPITQFGNFSINYNMLGSYFKNADDNFENFKIDFSKCDIGLTIFVQN